MLFFHKKNVRNHLINLRAIGVLSRDKYLFSLHPNQTQKSLKQIKPKKITKTRLISFSKLSL